MWLFNGGEPLATSVLGFVEVASALTRQQSPRQLDEPRLAQLREELKDDSDNLTGLALTDHLVERAVSVTEHYKLRAADAIHLATALDLRDAMAGTNESVVLVTSDHELLEAARRAGLIAEDPVISEHRS